VAADLLLLAEPQLDQSLANRLPVAALVPQFCIVCVIVSFIFEDSVNSITLSLQEFILFLQQLHFHVGSSCFIVVALPDL
jgi:hypothetical protein